MRTSFSVVPVSFQVAQALIYLEPKIRVTDAAWLQWSS